MNLAKSTDPTKTRAWGSTNPMDCPSPSARPEPVIAWMVACLGQNAKARDHPRANSVAAPVTAKVVRPPVARSLMENKNVSTCKPIPHTAVRAAKSAKTGKRVSAENANVRDFCPTTARASAKTSCQITKTAVLAAKSAMPVSSAQAEYALTTAPQDNPLVRGAALI